MVYPKKAGFSGRTDHVTDELVSVLSGGASFDFKDLFLVVYAGLKLKMRASGGEEMLRLRCHEKLQTLAKRGLVKKTGKTYTGLQGIEQASREHVLAKTQTAYTAYTARVAAA